MKFVFNDAKATQAAAFLLKENGGSMDTYCFIKMIYLADREAMRKWAEPITGDEGCSMKLGPVLSKIYDLTKGKELAKNWNAHLSDSDPDANQIELKADPGGKELSQSEVEILRDIWIRFHKFTFSQMKEYTHSLPEYDASVIETNTSKPISPESTLRALKFDESKIQQAEKQYREMVLMGDVFGAF